MTDVTTSTEAAVGKRARRGLAMKNLIPSQDWINTNIVAKGKGTQLIIGRIVGMCMSIEEKHNEHQGQILKSLVMNGVFEGESFVTGELIDASSVYMPMAYAEKVQALFMGDASLKMVEIDADIGLEATGKSIPYEWVVIAYREGAEMAVLKRIRGSRGRPANAVGGPTPALAPLAPVAALPDHTAGDGELIEQEPLIDADHDDHGGTSHDDTPAPAPKGKAAK